MRHSVLIVCLAAGLGACANPLAPEERDSPLRTLGSSFTMERIGSHLEARIPFMYTNTTGDAVYIANCGGGFFYALQQRSGRGWTAVWGPILPLCLSAPIVIEAGDTFSGTHRVGIAGLPTKLDPGPYRLIWPALSSYEDKLSEESDYQDFGRRLPIHDRVSNEFTLLEP